MNSKEYSEYLHHPLWEKKRVEVFDHYGRACSKCGSSKHLTVHHKTYTKGKMPWEYPIENFEVLCERCHSKSHSLKYTQKKCEICGALISEKFIYCLRCHNEQVAKLQQRNEDVENRIKELSRCLGTEKLKNQNLNFKEYDRLKSEHDNLLSERYQMEKRLQELEHMRKSDSREVKSQLKSIKGWVIGLSLIVFALITTASILFLLKDDMSTADSDMMSVEVKNVEASSIKVESKPGTLQDKSVTKGNLPAITKEDVGKKVTFVGKVLSIYNHPKGHKFLTIVVYGSNQEISVPIFESLQYENPDLNAASIVKVSGKVSTYRNKLQVILNDQTSLVILKKGISTEIQKIPIGQINEALRGHLVKASGTIHGYYEKNETVFFSLMDNQSNRIKAVLFKPEANELKARKTLIVSAEKDGYPVTVIGTVNVFKGNLQLIVDKVYR